MRGSSGKLLLRRAGIPQSGDKKQIFLLQTASSTKITWALVSPRIPGKALLVYKTFISRIVGPFQKAKGRKSKQIHQTVTACVHAGKQSGRFWEQSEGEWVRTEALATRKAQKSNRRDRGFGNQGVEA